jgi:hypothetical protein
MIPAELFEHEIMGQIPWAAGTKQYNTAELPQNTKKTPCSQAAREH